MKESVLAVDILKSKFRAMNLFSVHISEKFKKEKLQESGRHFILFPVSQSAADHVPPRQVFSENSTAMKESGLKALNRQGMIRQATSVR